MFVYILFRNPLLIGISHIQVGVALDATLTPSCFVRKKRKIDQSCQITYLLITKCGAYPIWVVGDKAEEQE